MPSLYRPLQAGSLRIGGNLLLAPMAGYTDRAFRRICLDWGADLAFTEMVSCEGLVHNSQKTASLMDPARGEEHPAIQIFTGDPAKAAAAIPSLLTRSPALIDLNCGCPVPKVIKNRAGSDLMRDPSRLGRIVAALKQALAERGVSIPVSVKIRSGWDKQSLNFREAGEAACEAGADMVSLHPRTRSQGYAGEADWELIARLKESLPVPVIGSGDLFTPEAAERMLRETGCDGVMIARGAVGNPFIFRRTRALLETGAPAPAPPREERFSTALHHLDLAVAAHGEPRACKEMKKHLCSYTKGSPGSAALRNRIVHAETAAEYRAILLDQDK